MEYVTLGKTGLKISRLGFGGIPIQKVDATATRKLIVAMAEKGINYIDTAHPYHNGASEPFVGKALKNYDRSSFYLATKMPIWAIESKEQALEIFEGQLQKLQTEYVDFYLLHALDNAKWEKCLNLGLVDLCLDLQKQ